MSELACSQRHVAASKVDSTYKSVIQRTGIQAGEEGYYIRVDGKTVLDGAAIASTANPDGSLEQDSASRVLFSTKKAGMSLGEFLSTDDGKRMFGLTGGVQGLPGTLAGKSYGVGSFQDRLIECFAGRHDMIGGQWAGLYDDQGNAARDRSPLVKNAHNAWAVAAIPLAAPPAMAKALPPEVWQAITILLRSSP